MLRNVEVSGYFNGIVCNEHTDGDGINLDCNVNGLSFAKANHASRFGRVCAQRNTHDITVTGAHGFSIQQLDVEQVGPGQSNPENAWQKTIADINDPANVGVGDVTYWVVEGAVGPVPTFIKHGGNNIHARRIGAAPNCSKPLKSDDDAHSGTSIDDRVFNAADFGAIDDGVTNNTDAFTACLDALIAAGGGTMLLPRSQVGIYRGNIIIHDPGTPNLWTIEIVGGVEPTPVYGTVGKQTFCSNCSHVVVQSLEPSGPAVISVAAGGSGYESFSNIFLSIHNLEVRTYDNPGISGIDVGFAQQCSLLNVFINTGVYGVQASQPTHGTSGLITPLCNNGAYIMLRNLVVSGYFNGIVCNEHTGEKLRLLLVVLQCPAEKRWFVKTGSG